jgi:acyl-CoA synthetase (NDP forming)
LDNLTHYAGDIFLVNPKYERLGSRPCYPSLSALPVVPDCVVITLPQHAVVNAAREAADVGAGGAIVYASGFAETRSAERVAQQQLLIDIARGSGMRILGPNCVGVVNNLIGAGLLFQVGYATLNRIAGRVGLVSQSGALGYAVLQGVQHGRAYTHMLSSGNSCDVDAFDLANYLVEEPECRAVACILEGINVAKSLHELGERAQIARKPVLIYKTAVDAAGAEAAKSHTGSLASSSAALEAAMRRGNFVQVSSLAELAETADFFAKTSAPAGEGIAIMATSGGAAVMAADAASQHGMDLPQPGVDAQKVLEASIPEFGSAKNPCDITGQVLNDPLSYVACARAMLSDPAYGALVLPQVTPNEAMAEQRCAAASQLSAEAGKPVCIVWLPEWLEGPGSGIYARDERVSFFRAMDRCFSALSKWQHWHHRLRAPRAPDVIRKLSSEKVMHALDLLRGQPQVVTERVAKEIISACGVPVVSEIHATSSQDAVQAAERLGYPVVLKLDSPHAAHKTEMGFVRIGLVDALSVIDACNEMTLRAEDVRSDGFLVQSMVNGHVELMLGMKRDPVFGPLVLVGLGGVFAELLGDVASELAPVSLEVASGMLRRLVAYPILEGYRGKPGVDLDRVAKIISDFSLLCHELDSQIEEIDVNPLVCSAREVTAVDALMLRRMLNTA